MITLHRMAAMTLVLCCLLVATGFLAPVARAGEPERETDPRREAPRKGEPKKDRSGGQRGGGDSRGDAQNETRDTRDEDRGGGLRGQGEPPDRPPAPPLADPHGPKTTQPYTVPPSGPTYIPTVPTYQEQEIEIYCDDAWVCVVDELDEYIAWMLSRQTSIPWKHFVAGRDEGLSWQALVDQLGVESWEIFAALDEEAPFDVKTTALQDARLRAMAKAHLAGVDLRRFDCGFPVLLRGVSAEERNPRRSPFQTQHRRVAPPGLDSVDDDIAARIESETGWCFQSLIEARKFLGSWSRVAREFYLSPFLFEASFGLELDVRWLDSRRRVEYPNEDRIREVAIKDAWPELSRR